MDLCSLKVATSNFQFECDICSKTFPNEVRLTLHSASDHGIHKNMCEYCGKKFITSDILAEHCKKMHQNEIREYVCQSCSKTFKTQDLCDEHNEVQHSKKYICGICETLCFATESELKKHLVSHTLQDSSVKPDEPQKTATESVEALPIVEISNGKPRNPKRKSKSKSPKKTSKTIGDVVGNSKVIVERNEINPDLFEHPLCKIQDDLDEFQKLMKLAEACCQASKVVPKKDNKKKQKSHTNRKENTRKPKKTETVIVEPAFTPIPTTSSDVSSLSTVSDTTQYVTVPSQDLSLGGEERIEELQGHRLLEDFIIPALNAQTYGELLRWVSKPSVFGIKWLHKASAAWNTEECSVFLGWDMLKGRKLPTNPQEFVDSKQRLRAALRNLKSVKEIQKIGAYKIYKLLDEYLIRQAVTDEKTSSRGDSTKKREKSKIASSVRPSARQRVKNSKYTDYDSDLDALYEPSPKKKKTYCTAKSKRAAMVRKRAKSPVYEKPTTPSEMPSELSVKLEKEQKDEFEHNYAVPKRSTKVSQECWADSLEITPIKDEKIEVEEIVEATENIVMEVVVEPYGAMFADKHTFGGDNPDRFSRYEDHSSVAFQITI